MGDMWNEIFEEDQAPITEVFDPTWPFNFKWAYDAQTGQAHVWRVKGGVDGMPTHRQETRERWGRDVRVQDGDTLGLATYIPAEKKLDGTVVAPPDVHLQAYYNMPIPPEIYLWFEDHFPDAVVRQATVVKPRLGSKKLAVDDWNFDKLAPVDEPIYKWLWNERDGLLIWETKGEQGLPTHNQKCLAEWHRNLSVGWQGDMIGYALPGIPEPGVITVESYDGRPIPPAGFAAVKTQLAEWFPHDQIINDDEAGADAFNSNPQDYRTAALDWAWQHLVESHENRSESLSKPTVGVWKGLTRLFSKPAVWEKTADADMQGAMVGLFLDEETAKKLKVRGGEPIENMHITLLYFADKAKDRDDWDEVRKIVEQVANQTPPLSGKISGYGVFNAPDGDVLWASPSVQGLAELRHKLYEACEDAGFHVNTEHDWAPHITLKYDHKGKLPENDGVELEFKELSFAQGEKQDHFEFTGNFEKKAGDDYTADNDDDIDDSMNFEYRTPYIYLPASDDLYWGLPGQYHDTLHSWIRDNHGVDALSEPSVYGSVYSLGGQKFQEVHRDQWPNAYTDEYNQIRPNTQKFLEERVGVPFGKSGVPDMTDFEVADYWDSHLASNDYLDWSGWEGAHKFVTDGKEILTDPEAGGIDPSNWKGADELRKKFLSFHPDAKGLIAGWMVPTADKMGLGIWAPAAGHGDKHEPGLHDLIKIVEKQFGKPAHLITNEAHLADDKMYNPGQVSEWQQM